MKKKKKLSTFQVHVSALTEKILLQPDFKGIMIQMT